MLLQSYKMLSMSVGASVVLIGTTIGTETANSAVVTKQNGTSAKSQSMQRTEQITYCIL